MTEDQDLQQEIDQKLAHATGRIIEQARIRDYEEAYRLLHAHGVCYGFGLLVIGTGTIGLTVLFYARFPWTTPITLAIAFASWVAGALVLDIRNWRRTRLARRLLNRSSKR